MRSVVLALTLAAAFTAPAFAAPVTFFGEDINLAGDPNQAPTTNADAAKASFFVNLVGVGTETFESIPVGTHTPFAVSFGSAGTATINSGGFIASGNDGYGRYPISGSQYVYDGGSSLGINFSAPISAFGFYGTDIGDFGGQLTLTLTDSLNNVTTLTIPNTIGSSGSTTGSNLYFGFYDTTATYTSISLNNSSTSDIFGFDDFSIGSRQQVVPTPEAGTVGVLLAGMGMLGVAVRRRGLVQPRLTARPVLG
jgi:hypothetical protein